MGLVAAGSALLGLFLGRWIDSRFGTKPLVTLALLVVGALVGQIAMYRLAFASRRRLLAQDTEHFPEALPRFGLALRVLGVVVGPALLGFAMGRWLDNVLQTRIVATMLLMLGGLAVGILGSLHLIRATRLTSKQGDR